MPLSNPLAATVADISSVQNALYGAAGVASYSAAAAAANGVSISEVIRYIQETQIGTLTNTGGTATIGAILGDMNNEPIYNRLYEIERHFHGWERWMCTAVTTDTEVHVADRIGTAATAVTLHPHQRQQHLGGMGADPRQQRYAGRGRQRQVRFAPGDGTGGQPGRALFRPGRVRHRARRR